MLTFYLVAAVTLNHKCACALQDGVEVHKTMLKSKDVDTRREAVRWFGETQPKGATSILIDVLETDGAWAVRSDAGSYLGKIGDRAAIDALIEALDKSEKSVLEDPSSRENICLRTYEIALKDITGYDLRTAKVWRAWREKNPK